MKIVEVINPNAGDGFKMVTIELNVEGSTIDANFFIHPDGRVEAHKNTQSDLVRQFLQIIKKDIQSLAKVTETTADKNT